MALGYLRVAGESTPGNESNTPTLTTKKTFVPIESYTLEPGFQHLLRENELVNTDLPRAALPNVANPNWQMSVRAYPDVLGQLLTTMLGAPTTTAGNGTITDPDSTAVPASAYRHVWTTPGLTGVSPQTAQHDLAYTDEAVYFKVKGAATQSLAITNPEDDAVMLAASGPALYATRQSDPSLSPTYEADSVQAFMRRHASLSWLSGAADPADCSVTITNPSAPRHHFGSGSRWPSRMYKGDSPILVTGSIPMELIDQQDYDGLKDATGFTATLKWASDTVIASSYTYKLWIASAASSCQYIGGGPNPLTNVRRRGASFDFRMSGAVTITLVNATSDYS